MNNQHNQHLHHMNNRRNFLKQVSLLSVGAFTTNIAAPVFANANRRQKSTMEDSLTVPPYLQNLTATSVYVMFITAVKSYSWIEYEGSDGTVQKAHMEDDGLYDAYVKLNKIYIPDLQPGRAYRYRVCSKPITLFEPYKLEYGEEVRTAWFTFNTPAADAKEVSCVVLNDIHDSPEAFGKLLSLVKDRPYEFVALNGDTFNYQTDEQQIIDHLLLPCTNVFASQKPFLMIRGNHETRGKFRREFKNYFALPNDKYHFSFEQGPVFWVVLDTGEDKPDDHPVYAGIVDFDGLRERQAKWLAEVVETKAYKEAKYRVVLMHIPPYHSGDWHGPMHCQKLFSPIFEANNVDLVVSGHTHRYGVHPPDTDHSYPILIGGGSKDGSRTIMHIAANAQQLHVDMIRDDGEKVGEYTVS
ncbi:metallophosphoesterase family protein [Sphingobacterium chuzhouense]|uniref:Metallophosphoesterase n=1 Tax=Sphingobacterium chuzhouense TaxID=1742264 RepID=A0ABR7XX00_9SPHI|nr:FN3 domain-containing metallophosphoesterase family protein [Sphingobacterium chuzhouense]MBD1423588.1 metallophosphoesterase [Sphingobacterium chuzhouense]